MPEFYVIFARKMPEFYMIIATKIFSRFFVGGGVYLPPWPPPPAKYNFVILFLVLSMNNRATLKDKEVLLTRTRSIKWKTCLYCRSMRMKSLRPAMTQWTSWSACEWSRLDVPPELIHSSDSINHELKPQLRHRGNCIRTQCTYRVAKKWTPNALDKTSSNIDQFSKFFHCTYNLQKICNAAVINYPTTPQMRCYTTLWNDYVISHKFT